MDQPHTDTLVLDMPEGVLHFNIPPMAGRHRVADIAAALMPFCDAVNDLGAGIAKQFGKSVSCRAGCGVCCCQMVPLSPPEAVMVNDVITGLPQRHREQAEAGFADARKKLHDAGLLDRLYELYSRKSTGEETLALNRRYFELGIPCPFLSGQSCSIHPSRPSRCREYSVMSDPALCANPFENPVRRLPVTLKLSEALAFAWASLTRTKPQFIPLIDAPSWVRANPEAAGLRIEGAQQFMRSVLEFTCAEANRRASK